MSRFKVERTTRTAQAGLGLLVVLLAVLVSLPYWAGRADMRLVMEICYFLALAQMWNLLAGYAGLVSIGQQAFVGLGGYALFVGAIYLGLHPLLAIVAAGLAAAVFAVPTAFVVFRLRGAYFAVGTWVVAEVYRLSFAQISALGGGSGMSLPIDVVKQLGDSPLGRDMIFYFICLGLAVGTTFLVYWLLRVRYGLALTAIRDSEVASRSLGVDAFRTKFGVYVLVAGVTGMIGAVIFLLKLRISPDAAFSLQDWTASVLFIVIIGGIGRIEGPIVGTIVFFVLRGLLADLGSWYLIVLGALAVLAMLFAPQGIWGLVAERFGWHFFPVRRRLRVGGAGTGGPE